MRKWKHVQKSVGQNGGLVVLPARLLSQTLCSIEHAFSWQSKEGQE